MAKKLSDNLHGRLYINGYGRGFKEDYPLPTATGYSDAITQMGKILEARQALLADGTSIVYSSVSRYQNTPDRRVMWQCPLDPIPTDTEHADSDTIEGVDKIQVCYQVTFETADGKAVNRYIRAIRDSWVVHGVWTIIPSSTTVGVPGAMPVANSTAIAYLTHYLNTVGYYTGRIDPASLKIAGLNAVFQPFVAFNIAQVTTRKTGRAFRSGKGRIVP